MIMNSRLLSFSSCPSSKTPKLELRVSMTWNSNQYTVGYTHTKGLGPVSEDQIKEPTLF